MITFRKGRRGIVAALAAALLAGALSGCDPLTSGGNGGTGGGGEPADPRYSDQIVWQIQTWKGDEITNTEIVGSITGIVADGGVPNIESDERGERGPTDSFRGNTPIVYTLDVSPTVVAVSLTVEGLVDGGETLLCYGEQDGREVPGTYASKTASKDIGSSKVRLSVTCYWSPMSD